MRIVCSLTTIPPRIKLIQTTINTLLNQTRKPDLIYVTVAKKYSREDLIGINLEIPEFLKIPSVKIVYLENDPGPIAKLIGVLQEENDPETLIITVDDDVAYHSEMVRLFEEAAIKEGDKALCTTCYNFSPKFPFMRGITATNFWFQKLTTILPEDENHPINFIMGFSGAAYKRKFFDSKELLQWNSEDSLYKRCDDAVISAYLNTKGIKISTVKTPENLKYEEKDFNLHGAEFALSKDGYKSAVNHMKVLAKLGRSKNAFQGNLNNLQGDIFLKLFLIIILILFIVVLMIAGIIVFKKKNVTKGIIVQK